MKLEKFKEKDHKKRFIVIFTVCCILLLAGVLLYNSFAVFTEEKQFNVVNGTYQDPGDIYFAYYVDGVITGELPKQNTGYIFDEEKSNCTNGVVPTFDNASWTFEANYSNYNATDYTRTKCNLYFKKTKTVSTVLGDLEVYTYTPDFTKSACDGAYFLHFLGNNMRHHHHPLFQIFLFRGTRNLRVIIGELLGLMEMEAFV